MAILIATIVTGIICFYLGWCAGLREGARRVERLKKTFEMFSKYYDLVIKTVADTLDKEIKKIEGEQNGSKQ